MCKFRLSHAFPKEKLARLFNYLFFSYYSLISGCTCCVTSVGLLEIPRWRCCARFSSRLCLLPSATDCLFETWAFPFQIVRWFYDISKHPLRTQKETIKPVFTFAERKTLNPGLQPWEANAPTPSSVLLPFHLSFQPLHSIRESRGHHIPSDSGKQEAARKQCP